MKMHLGPGRHAKGMTEVVTRAGEQSCFKPANLDEDILFVKQLSILKKVN